MSVIHDQQAEEGIGRWEGRCPSFKSDRNSIGVTSVVEICDRNMGHVGLHHGRRISLERGVVIAYVRWPK